MNTSIIAKLINISHPSYQVTFTSIKNLRFSTSINTFTLYSICSLCPSTWTKKNDSKNFEIWYDKGYEFFHRQTGLMLNDECSNIRFVDTKWMKVQDVRNIGELESMGGREWVGKFLESTSHIKNLQSICGIVQ